jgi:3-methyladenine DNA glycosylase AlkD
MARQRASAFGDKASRIEGHHVKTHEADELGKQIAALVEAGQITKAYALLAPILAQRTPFRLLDRIGAAIGAEPLPTANAFLARIADAKTEGGWVVIASALGQQLDRDFAGAFQRCRAYIIAADVWYATDILGERVPGPALVVDMERVLTLLAPWRKDANYWVRRTVGVAVHFWAKRSRGAPEHIPQAKELLTFLEPMFEERDVDAIKGVGWGLKTLGKYYPELAVDWLAAQVVKHRGRYRALMLRKALTYLPPEQRARIAKAVS